jgi:GNAT superfamily N-acetyltransferase
MGDFNIRRATPDDADELIALRVEFFHSMIAHGMQNGPKDITSYVHLTTPKLLRSRFAFLLMAEMPGEETGTAGYLLGQMKTRPGNFSYSPVGFIHELFIIPAQRRKGAAQELFFALKDFYKGEGVKWLELEVLVSNPASHAFWEKMGFRPRLLMMDQPLIIDKDETA